MKAITLAPDIINKIQRIFGILALIAFISTIFFALKNTNRFFESYLTAYTFTLSITLGSLFLVMITHLTKAHWVVSVRRIPEIISRNFVLMSILFIPIFFGLEHLYHWLEPGAVEHDHLLQIKEPYLNKSFFVIRLALYFITWHIISNFYTKNSIKQDRNGDSNITKKLQSKAAISILAYALTITFAAFDLLMSIEPHWFSTIFGVFYFGISILLALCIITLIYIFIYKKNILPNVVNKSHIHDIGKLIFGFLIFWAYISFSQYFLIWYANIPEETFWYLKRGTASWKPISYVLVLGHFLIPFFLFMSKHFKRNLAIHIFIAMLLITMSYLDIYYIIMPTFLKTFQIHVLDISTLIFTVSILGYFCTKNLKNVSLYAYKDPRINESVKLDTH